MLFLSFFKGAEYWYDLHLSRYLYQWSKTSTISLILQKKPRYDLYTKIFIRSGLKYFTCNLFFLQLRGIQFQKWNYFVIFSGEFLKKIFLRFQENGGLLRWMSYENPKMPVLTLKLYIFCKNNTTDLNFSHRLRLPLVIQKN